MRASNQHRSCTPDSDSLSSCIQGMIRSSCRTGLSSPFRTRLLCCIFSFQTTSSLPFCFRAVRDNRHKGILFVTSLSDPLSLRREVRTSQAKKTDDRHKLKSAIHNERRTFRQAGANISRPITHTSTRRPDFCWQSCNNLLLQPTLPKSILKGCTEQTATS